MMSKYLNANATIGYKGRASEGSPNIVRTQYDDYGIVTMIGSSKWDIMSKSSS